MFKSDTARKRSNFLPFAILRLGLSVTIFCVFAIGVYQAFKHFSGIDPAKSDPKTLILSLATSEGAANFATGMLNISFDEIIASAKQFAKNPSAFLQNPKSVFMPVKDKPSSETVLDPNAKKILSFALVADSHNDNDNLAKALKQATERGVKFVIGLGDYTDVGSKEELQKAKKVFLDSGMPYYLTAGDHDLWSSRNFGLEADKLFFETFGPLYQAFSDQGIRFIIIYNSDNYLGIDKVQMDWIEGELNRVRSGAFSKTFVFLDEPTFHPSSDHVMGKETPALKEQAKSLNQMFKSSKVAELFFADTHFATNYKEPETGLNMTVVGALTGTRNAQKPRFAIVDVYDNGSYNISDIEIQ